MPSSRTIAIGFGSFGAICADRGLPVRVLRATLFANGSVRHKAYLPVVFTAQESAPAADGLHVAIPSLTALGEPVL